MRQALCVLILLVLPSVGWAAPVDLWRVPAVVQALGTSSCLTLPGLLASCQRQCSSAVVTSGFRDPRGVSRYRRVPGLHLGYDVAMPAGTRVVCAAAGEVRAVTPWTEVEWGVTVRHADGTEATYGHLVDPEVAVGERVSVGQALGAVAVDHLDVKVRDACGQPLDFGAAAPQQGRLAARWLQARFAKAEAEQRCKALDAELGALRAALRPVPPGADQDALRLRAGLISVKEAHRRQQRRAASQRLLAQQRQRAMWVAQESAAARAELRSASRQLGEVEGLARRAGLRWTAVESLIRQHLAKDARLRAAVALARRQISAQPAEATHALRVRPPAELRRLTALYRLGAISRRSLELATGRALPVESMQD